MRIFITGATGLIGKQLVAALTARGDQVVALSRDAARAKRVLPSSATIVEGDVTRAGDWQGSAAECEAAVHLAGELVVGRWTDEKKKQITASRIDSTRAVVKALQRRSTPTTLVCASAVGYYGNHGDSDQILDESAAAGNDFLAQLCVAWEAEAQALGAPHRVAQVRTGVVLAKDGGALRAMLPAFKMFVGGPVGSGTQWVPWIHLDDIVGIFLLALDDARAVGALNGAAPTPVTMKTLAETIGKTLGRPSWLPAPAFALRALFGEGADPVLAGQRVVPARAEALGYHFNYPTIAAALAAILR